MEYPDGPVFLDTAGPVFAGALDVPDKRGHVPSLHL